MAKRSQRTPPEGLSCMGTFDDITEEAKNYCEYQTMPSGQWLPAQFCCELVQMLVDSQFQKYMDAVQKADCAAALRRAIKDGPPIYVQDNTALPVPEGDTHIEKLWYASDGQERSAKLTNALEGDEREKLWNEHKEYLKNLEISETAEKDKGVVMPDEE